MTGIVRRLSLSPLTPQHATSRPAEFSAVASTSKTAIVPSNQLSGGAGRANSLEPSPYPSLPLQASASGNGVVADPASPGASKKRTVTAALGPTAAAAGPTAPEAVAPVRKPLGGGGAAPGKKRGLKRL